MNYKVAIGIQSTVYPDHELSLSDWRLYIIVRNIAQLKMVRSRNNSLNQAINPTLPSNRSIFK